MNSTSRPTSVRVLGSSLVSSPFAPQFKPYEYNGDQRFVPPKTDWPAPVEGGCEAVGCVRRAYARSYCEKHYRTFLTHGDANTPDGRRREWTPEQCGTERGYAAHRRHDTPICRARRDAKNAADRRRDAGRKARKTTA